MTDRELITGEDIPAEETKAQEMAQRLGVTLEQLPGALMAAKQRLDEYARQINEFSEKFKTQPVNRAMRRAKRYGHHKLHG